MAITSNQKAILDRMNRRAEKVGLGTLIQNLELGVVAEGSISVAELEVGLSVGVAAEDAHTTSREENVAGLSSAIALANDIKAKMNAHYADIGAAGEEHAEPSTVSDAVAVADATDIASVVALASALQDSYVAHDADAAAATPDDHQAQTSANALASATNPTDLEESITVLNDVKAKLDLHMADSTSHTAGDSTSVAAADAAYGAAILVAEAAVAVGDQVQWSILDNGTGNVTGVSAVAAAGGITFTFSADPQNDAIISYVVLRASA